MPSISVIIPAYRGTRCLPVCLESLRGKTRMDGVDILVVDDASPEPVPVWTPAASAAIRCLRNESNLGFVRTANRGARAARGDILVFLNQDTEFISPGWDDELRRVFARQPGTGIVGAKLLYPDSGLVQFAGGCLDGEEWKSDYLYYRAPADIDALNRGREVDWVLGAFLAVRRDLFQRLDGFCTDFHSNYEDIDLCLRAKATGYRTRYEPNISLFHHETATGLSDVHQGRSLSLFRRKWLERLRRRQTDFYARDGLDGKAVRRLMRLFQRDFFSLWRVRRDFRLQTPAALREFSARNGAALLDSLVERYGAAGDEAEADFRYYRSRLPAAGGAGETLAADLRWIVAKGAPGLHRDESRLRLNLLGELSGGRADFHSERLAELAEFIAAVRAGAGRATGADVTSASLRARYLELSGELLEPMPAAERERHAAFILDHLEQFPNRSTAVAVLFRLAYLNHHGLAESLLGRARQMIAAEEWDPVKATQFAVNEASFHERSGNHRRALEVLQAAGGEETAAPHSLKSSLLFHLALNQARLGHAAAARRCLKTAVRLNPDNGRAQRLLAEVG